MKTITSTAQSAWSTWYAISDRCCQVTAAAWSIYVDLFFSPEAQARYEVAGRWLWLVSAFTFGLGVMARRAVQSWVDEEGALALPSPELEAAYFATTEELFAQADEVIARSMPQVITAPVTTLVIPVDRLTRSTALHAMTLKALTPLAQDLGLKTNKVRKADLISGILDAEGYTDRGAIPQATTEEE